MMNYIWTAIIILSFICAVFQGNMDTLTSSIFTSASDAVSLCIKLLGMLCLWSGLINIAEKAGITAFMGRLLSPLLDFLFPSFKKNKDVKNSIALNMTANLLGLGNAATPAGLDAIKKMSMINHSDTKPSMEMMTFIVINTAALRIIPSTVGAMRTQAGASEPMDIILCVWVSSVLSQIAAVTAIKLSNRRYKQ